jgi:hypothetical protein
MMLTLIPLSPITLKIRASTPVLVNLFLDYFNDTFSKTDNVLIPDALEFEVMSHCSHD